METLLLLLAGGWLFGGSTKVVVVDNTPKIPPKPIKLSKKEIEIRKNIKYTFNPSIYYNQI